VGCRKVERTKQSRNFDVKPFGENSPESCWHNVGQRLTRKINRFDHCCAFVTRLLNCATPLLLPPWAFSCIYARCVIKLLVTFRDNHAEMADESAGPSDAVPVSKQPPPEKPEAINLRTKIIFSFWAVILFLGLPTWWQTTSIYRATLPLEDMLNWVDGTVGSPLVLKL